jgi:hypothetical protein
MPLPISKPDDTTQRPPSSQDPNLLSLKFNQAVKEIVQWARRRERDESATRR